ncbi:hypothetical protein EJ02DRAFT_514399 [Clathrospora elynae]|uniref:Tc1-like transposase DDE domain-containing protein n=1 Tax=Clathrospora elynae TaxID=706981 RepID=A0A6A5SJ91_9PLEO|nr:hypothetical protein EJ02DRAFT_514399 [Clathrospora elynae]
MTGPKYQKEVKRRSSDPAWYDPRNIQYKKDHKPDPDTQDHFHIYTVLGYNFAWCMPYNTGNKNGKMNTETYINVILPAPNKYLLKIGGEWILWQDCDSAHISKKTLNWMDINRPDYINSSPKSPDLSIIETWVSLLKRKFYKRRCLSQKAGVDRFYKVWNELKPEHINQTIDSYPACLHACKNIYKGLATKHHLAFLRSILSEMKPLFHPIFQPTRCAVSYAKESDMIDLTIVPQSRRRARDRTTSFLQAADQFAAKCAQVSSGGNLSLHCPLAA